MSDNTNVSLKEHFESRLAALDRLFDLRINQINTATETALKTIPTKEAIDERLHALEKKQSYANGKSAVIAGLVSAGVSFLASYVLW